MLNKKGTVSAPSLARSIDRQLEYCLMIIIMKVYRRLLVTKTKEGKRFQT